MLHQKQGFLINFMRRNKVQKLALTKSDMVNKLMRSLEIRHKDAVDFYEVFFRELEKALMDEGLVKITSFASFIVKQKRKRMGRNPKTRVPIVINPRKTILFHPSRYLRDCVSEGMKKTK